MEEPMPFRCEKMDTSLLPSCGNSPSLGLTLVLSVIGFGLDRFYVGQVKMGVAFLIGSLSIVGLVVIIPVQIIAQIALIMSILTNKSCVFMYGDVIFEPPNVVDKIIAISWLTLMIVGIILGAITGLVI